MAYGSPASPDDVERYYTHIRRGHRPTSEQVSDLRRRYDAIGGISPLLERTQAQARGVQAALGDGFLVVLGQKHTPPFIEDGVAGLAEAGVRRAVALVLAPLYSALSVGEYLARAEAAAPFPIAGVRSWHLEDGLLELLAARVTAGLDRLPDGAEVVFTAHSLPARVEAMGDPYPVQLAETAVAVADRCGLAADRWSTGWQSAGRTPEPWLGPDILELVRQRAAAGAPGLLVCPVGFVADHLEVLYDLDIEAAAVAADTRLPFARTAALNDDPAFCATLAAVVRRHLA